MRRDLPKQFVALTAVLILALHTGAEAQILRRLVPQAAPQNAQAPAPQPLVPASPAPQYAPSASNQGTFGLTTLVPPMPNPSTMMTAPNLRSPVAPGVSTPSAAAPLKSRFGKLFAGQAAEQSQPTFVQPQPMPAQPRPHRMPAALMNPRGPRRSINQPSSG